jgi:2-polyprenyl-3-methyl-5-hydroxy-6-metoxy-1,4-benzoquinol methylase
MVHLENATVSVGNPLERIRASMDSPMADDPVFEFDDLFDENYLYFYEDILTAERNAADVDTVWKLLMLQPGQSALELGCGHGRIANALAGKGVRVTGLDRAGLSLKKRAKMLLRWAWT